MFVRFGGRRVFAKEGRLVFSGTHTSSRSHGQRLSAVIYKKLKKTFLLYI